VSNISTKNLTNGKSALLMDFDIPGFYEVYLARYLVFRDRHAILEASHDVERNSINDRR
jgi:hypothetical protein